jgi:hypothetical protein
MVEVPLNVQRSAKRLTKSGDLKVVLDHLVDEQAVVVLNMDVNNKDQLQLARVYYDALSTVVELVENIVKEAEQDG